MRRPRRRDKVARSRGSCAFSWLDIIRHTGAANLALVNPRRSVPTLNIAIEEMDLILINGTVASRYNCNDVVNPIGFNYTGVTCGTSSSTESY